MPKIGAHVSAAGSLTNSFLKAKEIGASCTQIFLTPPQQWYQKNYSDQEISDYKQAAQEASIGPNFIHGAYLMNLGTDNPVNLEKGISWLSYSLLETKKLGIDGTIFHVGSGKERTFEQVLPQVVTSIKEILKRSEGGSNLILENSAGAGNSIGDQVSELGEILKLVSDPRVKVCIDTQHAFASGYDIRTQIGADLLIAEIEKEVGLDKLVAIHTNDSKTDLGSHRDRHENIGEGLIGKEAFRYLLNHPKLQSIPFILEVPGFSDTGPDSKNIEILKSLI